jgi:hypothetical protein
LLFAAGAFEGAYYLAGYAVECALKACVAKQTREFDFPDKRLAERSYTHDLVQLLRISGVEANFAESIRANEALATSWDIVKDWSESSRYRWDVTEKSAEDIVAAVGNEKSGVLPWLKRYW